MKSLNIRIIAKPENYHKYKDMLEKAGFSISEDATLTFKETNDVKEAFLGEKDGLLEIIAIERIMMIESFGRIIILHTINEQFKIREKLYELDQILDPELFTRINKSMIIAKQGIKKIIPYLNGTMTLIMKNGIEVTVSRNYRQSFKKFIQF